MNVYLLQCRRNRGELQGNYSKHLLYTNAKAPSNGVSRHDQEAVSGLYIFYLVDVSQDNLPIIKYPQIFYCGGERIPSAATDKGLTQAS